MRAIYLALFILLVQVSLVVSADQEQCEPGFSEQGYIFTVTRKLLERNRGLGKGDFIFRICYCWGSDLLGRGCRTKYFMYTCQLDFQAAAVGYMADHNGASNTARDVHKIEKNPLIFTSCASNNRALYAPDDTRFRVYPDGKVTVKRQLTLHDGSVRFILNAWDAKGMRHSVPIVVLNEKEQVPDVSFGMS